MVFSLFAVLWCGQLLAQDKDSVVTLPPVLISSGTVVDQAVNKSFQKAFPEAENLKWYMLNKDYLAKFIEGDMKHNALFSKKGKLKYDVSYGTESSLPEEVRTKIKGAYADFNITHAANIKEAERNIWVVNLESLKQIVLVRVEEGDMEEVEKFTKP